MACYSIRVNVHLVDGTYELFRHHFAVPPSQAANGTQIAAVRGVLGSLLTMLEEGATHMGVATDHAIASFRNDLWPGYKTGEGTEPELLAQFPILEDGLRALGIVVWAMDDFEADDALASAAAKAAPQAERVIICTPDKDLAQSVIGTHVVQFDRRKRQLFDEAGVIEKFGVPPASIPDYLALVGDSADGFPGLAGWGAKSAAALLACYGDIDSIPDDPDEWQVTVRSAARLAATLAENRELAALFKQLATLRTDAPVFSDLDELRWRQPAPSLAETAAYLRAPWLLERAQALAASRR